MRKVLLAILILAIAFPSFGQDNIVDKSKLSFGIAPIHSIFIASKDRDAGAGIGLELHPSFKLNNNFSVSAFLRYSNIVNAVINNANCGKESSICDENFEHYFAAGLMLEYMAFEKLGFHVRIGGENAVFPESSSYIYGGGVSFYFPQKKPAISKSFSFTVYHTSNLSVNKSTGYPETEYFIYDTFVFQLGFRFQFHSLLTKR